MNENDTRVDDAISDLRLITLKQVQDTFGIGRTKANELIRAGELDAVRIGTALRVTRSSAKRWLDRQLGLGR